MLEAISTEIKLQSNYLSDNIDSIYFGGGTPSLLNGKEVSYLLQVINNVFKTEDVQEVTLEANPDDLTDHKLKELNEAGINRLSIGIQSFDDGVLTFLNRAHSSERGINCISSAKKAGFEAISADLIYGIPNRDHAMWKKDIDQLISQNPEHISAYCLTIEPKTAFGHWAKTNKIKPVEDEYAADQFDILINELERAGYEQYEVSNFCRDKKYARHNTAYWQQKPYLGIGPSAHSYNIVSRQYNVSNNAKYLKSINEGILPFEIEHLSEADKINDLLLTGLRTKWGVNLKKNNLSKHVSQSYINQLIDHKKAFLQNDFLILTKEGRLLADKISSDLFILE